LADCLRLGSGFQTGAVGMRSEWMGKRPHGFRIGRRPTGAATSVNAGRLVAGNHRSGTGRRHFYETRLRPSGTVRSIKKIDTFYQEGKWFRVSMWRKVPHRPCVFRWRGYEEPARFVVYRVEIPGHGAIRPSPSQAAQPRATGDSPSYAIAIALSDIRPFFTHALTIRRSAGPTRCFQTWMLFVVMVAVVTQWAVRAS